MIFYIFFFLNNIIQLNTLKNRIQTKIINNYKLFNNLNTVCETDIKYNLNWHIIGEKKDFIPNKLNKISIFNNDYLVWFDDLKYYAMDNHCSHRGASLYLGELKDNNVICPYHGYEFNKNGKLFKIPGLNFTEKNCYNQLTYNVIELNDWVYMNTISKELYEPNKINIYEEPEANDCSFSKITLNVPFNAYGRIVTENSLDVMHIGFVHTFGNRENPSPITENPPKLVNDSLYHYKSVYTYNSGKDSMAKSIFSTDNLIIENEFILPHTTVARVKFGNYTSTVITNVLPINNTNSKLFIKTYRNFWNSKDISLFDNLYNSVGDKITKDMMYNTVIQDKNVVENIKQKYAYGKFNMKYDKLQNVYRTFYKRLINDIKEND